MTEPHPLTSVNGPWVDNVKRWEKLQQEFPEARYSYNSPWFYGALHPDDDVVRANDLGVLIDRLMAREQTPRPQG